MDLNQHSASHQLVEKKLDFQVPFQAPFKDPKTAPHPGTHELRNDSSCLCWLIVLHKLPSSSPVLYKSHFLWYWVQCPGCHGAAVCQTHTKQHRHTIVSKSNPSSLDTDASHKACVAKTTFLKTALGHEPLPLLLPWPWPWPLP